MGVLSWLMRKVLATLAAVMLASGLTLIVAPAANAQSITMQPASSCLNGQAGPRDLVSVAGLTLNYKLLCGDPTKGVVHIASTHPISETGSDDQNVSGCFMRTVNDGHDVPANPGNKAFAVTNSAGVTSTVVFDTNTDEAITLFTNGGAGNNWAGCNSG